MSNNSQFKTKEFAKLQKKWYSKLAEEGFSDIERQDKVGKASERLKTDVLENVMHDYTVEQFNIKKEYYVLAGQFLYDHKFKTQTEKKIWKMHSEGIGIRDIAKILKEEGKVAYKRLVHETIKELVEEMKEYARKE